MQMVTIKITPIGKCNYMYPNSDNIIWFIQKYFPHIKIKNIIQAIHFFPGDNMVLGYATIEYIHTPRIISNLFFKKIKFNFAKDEWELSLYNSPIDPRLGSNASIKTNFILPNQTFEDILEEQDSSIEKYLECAKDEFRDANTNKVIAIFSLK